MEFIRRLTGVLLVGSLFAIGYVLINGPNDVYQIGGNAGFYLSGWRVILGSLGLLVGIPMFLTLFGVGGLVPNPQLGILGAVILAGVLALIFSASFEPPVAASAECAALANLLEEENPSSASIQATLLLGEGSDRAEIRDAARRVRASLTLGDEAAFSNALRDWAGVCTE